MVVTAVRLDLEDGIGRIVLSRPPVNALDRDAQEQLRRCAVLADERIDVAAVVLIGDGGIFSAGADIREMARMSHTDMVDWAPRLQAAFAAVAGIGKPVVAAVRGAALGGGCELALAADYRYCSEDCRIGLPEISLGVIPGAGGTQRLARLVGRSRAKELIFSGRTLDAEEALQLGLVDRVLPSDSVLPAAESWLRTLLDRRPHRLWHAKRAHRAP